MKSVYDIVEQEMLSCFSKSIFYTFPNTDILKRYFLAMLPNHPSLHTYSGKSSRATYWCDNQSLYEYFDRF